MRVEPIVDLSADSFTFNPFPSESEPHARVKYAMAVAGKILAELTAAPTKANPIQFTSSSEDESKFIWTALMCFGEKSKMQFRADAIITNIDSAFGNKRC